MLLAVGACGPSVPSGKIDLEALPVLSAHSDLRIGSVDDPEIGFSRIGGVDVDRDGSIYVFEGMDVQIRVYGADGRPLRRIGRRGEGPGEFMRVARFGVVGDTVWTFDYAGDRITLFDRDGALLSTGRAETRGIPLWNQCFGYVVPWTMRPDGFLTSSFSRVACNPNTPAPEIAAADSVPVPRVLFDASGAIVDTIGQDGGPPPRMARPPGASGNEVRWIRAGGSTYMVPQPPTELPSWTWLHDGRIVLEAPIPTSPAMPCLSVRWSCRARCGSCGVEGAPSGPSSEMTSTFPGSSATASRGSEHRARPWLPPRTFLSAQFTYTLWAMSGVRLGLLLISSGEGGQRRCTPIALFVSNQR